MTRISCDKEVVEWKRTKWEKNRVKDEKRGKNLSIRTSPTNCIYYISFGNGDETRERWRGGEGNLSKLYLIKRKETCILKCVCKVLQNLNI